MSDISKEELKELLNEIDPYQNGFVNLNDRGNRGEGIYYCVNKIRNHFDLNEPALPQGFKPYDKKETVKLPDDIGFVFCFEDGSISNEFHCKAELNGVRFSEKLAGYKITKVPTLKPDPENIPDSVYYICHEPRHSLDLSYQLGIYCCDHEKLERYTYVKAGLAYATKQHAQLALDHKLYPDDIKRVIES